MPCVLWNPCVRRPSSRSIALTHVVLSELVNNLEYDGGLGMAEPHGVIGECRRAVTVLICGRVMVRVLSWSDVCDRVGGCAWVHELLVLVRAW